MESVVDQNPLNKYSRSPCYNPLWYQHYHLVHASRAAHLRTRYLTTPKQILHDLEIYLQYLFLSLPRLCHTAFSPFSIKPKIDTPAELETREIRDVVFVATFNKLHTPRPFVFFANTLPITTSASQSVYSQNQTTDMEPSATNAMAPIILDEILVKSEPLPNCDTLNRSNGLLPSAPIPTCRLRLVDEKFSGNVNND